jgi:hypothetical protein
MSQDHAWFLRPVKIADVDVCVAGGKCPVLGISSVLLQIRECMYVPWNDRTLRTSPRIAYRQDHVPNAASKSQLDLFGNAIIEDAILDDIGESWHVKDFNKARNLNGK